MTRTAPWALMALLAASALEAQEPRVGGGIIVSQMRVQSNVVDVSEALDGTGVGIELTGRLGVGVLTIEYLQANLAPSTPRTVARDASEGAVMIGAEVWDVLRLSTGAHRRHFFTDAGSQRWTMWEARLRAQVPLLAGITEGYAELRPVLSGSISFPGAWGSGFGGEAGVIARAPRLPGWLRIGYRVERYELDDGTRTETTDGLVVTLGITRR